MPINMMEKRNGTRGKQADLPTDFLSLVVEIFSTQFDSELKKLAKVQADPSFSAYGSVFPDEVVVCITLAHPGQIVATSVFASIDFDPKASAPNLQDSLGLCVDAIGSVYQTLLGPDAGGGLEESPFEWTEMEIEQKKVWVKMDRSNPSLDRLADDWLKKNDPRTREELEQEQRETEKLFFTGPKSNPKKLDS